MRSFFVLLLMIIVSAAVGKEPGNPCKIAINEKTDYQVLGIYGSPLESEWHLSLIHILTLPTILLV